MEYVGNDLKYVFSSTGDFDMVTMEWDMIFQVGNKSCKMTKRNVDDNYVLTCDQENMGCKLHEDTGEWFFMLDTTFFGPGELRAVLYAYIPDSDFEATTEFPTLDGARCEVRKFQLETLKI